jgi:acetyl esterase/lipase
MDKRRTGWMKRVLLLTALTLTAQTASAGWLRDRLIERRAQRDAEASNAGNASMRVLRDIPYGSDENQRFDVYLPRQTQNAPVIFIVHGGGWRRGDKEGRTVVQNKVARWVPRGFIVISADYRMLPQAAPIEQAEDVARALAAAQAKAASWGGDRSKFILIGHSAGAHLVALLSASRELAAKAGATPWLGTVALDSAAMDVVQMMQARHAPLYDQAFGRDPQYWRAASPYYALAAGGPPILAVCSSRRQESCGQAKKFAAKANDIGVRAQVLEQDLSHMEINDKLGLDSAYTRSVEAFMAGLDAAIANSLMRPQSNLESAPKLAPQSAH